VVGGDRDEELTAAARHEDSGIDADSQAAELGRADHLLQWQTLDPLPDHLLELGGRPRGIAEEPGLILGEYASGGSQPGDDSLVF
jgi:hypothetical protein